ncbi:hypothetical protein F9K91_21225 [Brucella tritici]|uniref:Single-stranded DNA-binding protein BPT7 domain-containing protein n=1 Tax=Brucella tritici TaxID=94626 RepID=A0A7X6JB22_9HYPH|nr:hypothetical protein [Brucella tritici]KAB2662760.1 hypothetical protein F9K91_21225 [Brucella tritici]NKW09117.1 hypothetical protein [Brucella tritici]
MAAFLFSPVGPFRHPWFNTPDTKFNADGLYHADQILSGKAAEAQARKIEEAAQAALAEYTQEMKPGEAKKWKIYLPFERLEDDETGEPTGEILFTYKQNAKIKTKKGEIKDITIGIFDSQDNQMDTPIWNGSEGRVAFTMRPITMVSSKQVGVRLDFAKVQITKLKSGGSSGGGFGETIEGGYVVDDEPKGFGGGNPDSSIEEEEQY